MKEEDKDLNYWKENAEECYMTTPIGVLRYITELEKVVENNAVLPVVVGSTLHKVTQRELLDNEFYCSKCDTIHTKTAYAVAQRAMNVDLVFTCTCGNKIDL